MVEIRTKRERKARPEKTIEELKREEWLTVAEAGRYARIPRSKMYELVKAGEVPATKIPGYGNTYKVNRRRLDQWMHENEYDPAKEYEDD